MRSVAELGTRATAGHSIGYVGVTRVHITLLGGFDVVVAGREVPLSEWRRRQAAALVKLLALAPGWSLHRERVIDALWPDLDVDEAAPRLH